MIKLIRAQLNQSYCRSFLIKLFICSLNSPPSPAPRLHINVWFDSPDTSRKIQKMKVYETKSILGSANRRWWDFELRYWRNKKTTIKDGNVDFSFTCVWLSEWIKLFSIRRGFDSRGVKEEHRVHLKKPSCMHRPWELINDIINCPPLHSTHKLLTHKLSLCLSFNLSSTPSTSSAVLFYLSCLSLFCSVLFFFFSLSRSPLLFLFLYLDFSMPGLSVASICKFLFRLFSLP